jgi:hypothetical protein
MAVVDINEYDSLARDARGDVIQTGKEPAKAFQQVAIGGASAQSNPFSDATRFVRVHVDAPCRLQFGSNPVAAATTMRMAGGATEFFEVTPGQRVAVITST